MIVDPRSYLFSLEQFGIKFGLDNIRALVAELGHPERRFRSLHVAGTNGKGSVTAMTEAVVRASGLRTGRYTSPHLVDLTERFAIDGHAVDNTTLERAVTDVREAAERLRQRGQMTSHPTFFEVTTAAAFQIFAEAAVDIAVCEVGLGGRLDATNVLSPMATAITSIGFDHQQYLGSTLAAIAAEKAGIIKAATPVIVGALPSEARRIVELAAHDAGAPMVYASEGVAVQSLEPAGNGRQRVAIRTPRCDYGELELALDGLHQVGNALVAIRLLEAIPATAATITPGAVRAGMAGVEWPGRLQRIEQPAGRVALLDAAHNPEGAAALAAYLRPRGALPFVFAAMRDKDAEAILAALRGTVSALVLTRASNPRSADPQALAAVAERTLGRIPVRIAATPAEALTMGWTFGPEIVVAGSIFLLGDILKALKRS